MVPGTRSRLGRLQPSVFGRLSAERTTSVGFTGKPPRRGGKTRPAWRHSGATTRDAAARHVCEVWNHGTFG